MDSTPPEQPKPERIQVESGVTIVPPKKIRPLAQGLLDMFSQPFKTIIDNMPPPELEPDQTFQEEIKNFGPRLEGIQSFLQKLRRTKTAKISFTRNWRKRKQHIATAYFSLSNKLDPETPLQPKKVIIPESLTLKIGAALGNIIGNQLSYVKGYVEIIKLRTASPEIKAKLDEVYPFINELVDKFLLIQNADYQLEILTDAQGNTTITPTPRPTPQP